MNVTLRPLEDRDLDTIYQHMTDPVSIRMAAFTAENQTDRRAFLNRMSRLRADASISYRVIDIDGAIAGTIASFRIDDQPEVTYWVDRSLWGKGVASTALQIFLAEIPERPLYARRQRSAHTAERGAVDPAALDVPDRSDDVHPRLERVELVPALGEQLLVCRRGCAGAVVRELRPPEPARVRLVPDHDVVHVRCELEQAHDVAAVPTAEPCNQRGVPRLRVDGEDEARPAAVSSARRRASTVEPLGSGCPGDQRSAGGAAQSAERTIWSTLRLGALRPRIRCSHSP
jgi:hypothetical protein